MITLVHTDDGYVHVAWRGWRLGTLEYVSGNVVSGALVYRGCGWSTDFYSLDGIPDHWLAEKVSRFCRAVDRLKEAEAA